MKRNSSCLLLALAATLLLPAGSIMAENRKPDGQAFTQQLSQKANIASSKLPRPNGCPSNPKAYRYHRHPSNPDFTVLVWNKSPDVLALNATPTSGTVNVSNSSPWTEYLHPTPHGCHLRNTPSVVVDKDGRIHVATALSDSDHGTWPGGIYLSTSTDNGRTLTSQCIAKNRELYSDKVHSQPVLAIDTNSKSPYYNQAYLIWLQHEDGRDRYKLMFARSFDGGHTFSQPWKALAVVNEWRNPDNLKISIKHENHADTGQPAEVGTTITVEWTEAPASQTPSSPKSGYCTSTDGGEFFDTPTVQ